MRSCLRRTRYILATALALSTSAVVAATDGTTEGSPAGSPREVQPANRESNFNLHIYGYSYHPDRDGVRRNKLDNEFNWGLGLNYVLHEDARGVRFVEAGIYKDSGYNWAKLAGLGYQFKLGERWRLGGGLVGLQSTTYNHGKFFIAPLPILTYDFGTVKLNAIYAPRYEEYNQFDVFGFYVSIPFGKLGK